MLRSALLLVAASVVAASFVELDEAAADLYADEAAADLYADEAEFDSSYSHPASQSFFSSPNTRLAAPNLCSGGSVTLDSTDDFAPCVVKEGKKNKNVRILKSPKNNAGQCQMRFNSQAPGFLRAKLHHANLSATDNLTYTGAFGDQLRVTNDLKGMRLTLPTTFGQFNYASSPGRAKMAKDFVVVAVPLSNHCQKVIEAPAGTGGRLIFPGFDRRNYTRNTVCQWWITAPVGKKIVLKFNSFTVGTNVTNCQDSDYIGVDKSGDPTYMASPVRFCGNVIPADVTSDANKINVLAYGAQGGRGFCCTYDVIDG